MSSLGSRAYPCVEPRPLSAGTFRLRVRIHGAGASAGEARCLDGECQREIIAHIQVEQSIAYKKKVESN